MASSLSRSTTRSEGLSTRRTNVAVVAPRDRQPVIHNNNAHNRQQPPNIGRKKRARDGNHDVQDDIVIKKARIAIEIREGGLRKAEVAIFSSRPVDKEVEVVPQLVQKIPQPQPLPLPIAQLPVRKKEDISLSREDLRATEKGKAKTIHQKKIANGLQHELDRLQPRPTDINKDEKRKLRSQEGTRFKSELSAYFPEYDEVIGNEPKETHVLNLDTPITITDSAKHLKTQPIRTNGDYPVRHFSPSLFDDLHDAKRVDFSFLDKNYKQQGGVDPLSDVYLEQIHKKPERLEKTIRNSDKGRAQHEKDQVVRLLEGLQGHDWLKLMGVTGVTESKKKEFEPAREHFIRGCEVILDKFRSWRDEEKRRKLEREQALADAVGEDEVEEGEEEAEVMDQDTEVQSIEVDEEEGYLSDGDPPDYSDVDAMVARQLQEEAKARSALWGGHPKKLHVPEYIPPAMEKDFVSFFTKPHLRTAALGRHRRSGRSVAAWGHPIPEVPVTDFDLPEEFRDEETLKLRERAKRRVRRVSKN